MLYCWVPRAELWRASPPGGDHLLTIAGTFLDRNRSRLQDLERRYLEAGVREPFSLFEVAGIETEKSLDLVDLLRDRPFHVSERSATRSLSHHDILFARVVSVEGRTTMSGAGPIALTPDDKLDLIDFIERLRRRRRTLTDDDLWRDADTIRFQYLDLMRRRLNPLPPVLQNTDGEPLVFHTLHFALGSAASAFEKLHALDLARSKEEILAGACLDASGALEAVEFEWHQLGNPKHKSWENTVLGHLKIANRKLTVEVNSRSRAEQIRAEIEKRLTEGATFERMVVTTPEKMMEEERRNPRAAEKEKRRRQEEAELLANPEVQEQLARILDQRYEGWVDEKIPALGGKTPRQAVKTPVGRAKVEALLAGMERQPGQDLLGHKPPVARLRQKLGLL